MMARKSKIDELSVVADPWNPQRESYKIQNGACRVFLNLIFSQKLCAVQTTAKGPLHATQKGLKKTRKVT